MKLIKRCLITLLVGFSIAALIVWSKDIFSQTEIVNVFHILTDAFCVAGVLILSAGLLIFSSNEGTFDILAYGVNSFADMFRKKSTKKYPTFYDYRESRAEKKIPFGFLLISGLLLLGISVIMYFIYRQYC